MALDLGGKGRESYSGKWYKAIVIMFFVKRADFRIVPQ